MKKTNLFAVALIAVCVFALTACGGPKIAGNRYSMSDEELQLIFDYGTDGKVVVTENLKTVGVKLNLKGNYKTEGNKVKIYDVEIDSVKMAGMDVTDEFISELMSSDYDDPAVQYFVGEIEVIENTFKLKKTSGGIQMIFDEDSSDGTYSYLDLKKE